MATNRVKLPWADFKAFTSARSIPMHETAVGSYYLLEAFDGPVERECLLTESSDITDYTTNYQAAANVTYTDANGSPLTRTKITKTGWHYQCHTIEFETSKLSAIYNHDDSQTDLGYLSVKFYNSSGTELTAGTQTELDNNCVKTVLEWEADYDVELIGGTLYQASQPSTDVRIWVTAVPDLPVASGGSVPFCEGGVNLKYMGTGAVYDIDGKTPKLMPYNATYHTNKMRITITHDTGVTHPAMLVFKLFRENA